MKPNSRSLQAGRLWRTGFKLHIVSSHWEADYNYLYPTHCTVMIWQERRFNIWASTFVIAEMLKIAQRHLQNNNQV